LAGTAVAYSFDLTMDEMNNLNATTDLLGPWFQKLTVAIMGDANRERSNEELFTLTDTLGGLLLNRSTQFGVPYCGDAQLARPNFIYLVAAESRLASRMASGETLERVAGELRICKETARNQLKAVLAGIL
jgi:hypothetical protein